MSPITRITREVKRQAADRPLILLPWYLILLWRPDMALALNDSQGKAHFGKRAAFLAFTVNAFILIHGTVIGGVYPPWPHFLLFNVSLYGIAGLHMFFNHTRLSVEATETHSVVEERRKGKDFEATP